MIEACFGVPGSGKTYYAVHRSLQYIASGGSVFSNIRFHGVEPVEEPKGFERYKLSGSSNVIEVLLKNYGWDYQDGQYHYIDLDSMDSDLLSCIPRGTKSKPILLVLDEVNEWFDSLDGGKLKRDEKYRELFKFLRLSRHYHVDVLFLLQDFATLNARLRGLCQNIYKSTDMQRLRVPGIPFRFPFPWFLWQQYDKSGRVCVRSQTWPKEQHIFKCYDSFCEFGEISLSNSQFVSDFGKSGKLVKDKKKMNKYDRVFIYGILLLMLGVLFRSGRSTAVDSNVSVVTVTNVVERVTVSDSVLAVSPSDKDALLTVSFEPFFYGCDGYKKEWVLANGRRYIKGQRHPEGVVVDVNKDFVRIVGVGGRESFIYPLSIEHSLEHQRLGGANFGSIGMKTIPYRKPFEE